MKIRRGQIAAVALGLLSMPAWWLFTPSVKPNRSDAANALKELEDSAVFSSGIAQWKAQWDIDRYSEDYAGLVVRAAPSNWQFKYTPTSLFPLAPQPLVDALVRRIDRENPTARLEIEKILAESGVDLRDYRPVIGKLVKDLDPVVRLQAILAFEKVLGTMTKELVDMDQSPDPNIRETVLAVLAGRTDAGSDAVALFRRYAKSADAVLRDMAFRGLKNNGVSH